MINQLSRISIKFATIINELLINTNPNNKNRGSSFVYCNWVKGSGCILFTKILELFGFSQAKGGEKTNRKRYILLSSVIATDNQISNYIETFNKPDNCFGDIINVVIGSRIISEGIIRLNQGV